MIAWTKGFGNQALPGSSGPVAGQAVARYPGTSSTAVKHLSGCIGWRLNGTVVMQGFLLAKNFACCQMESVWRALMPRPQAPEMTRLMTTMKKTSLKRSERFEKRITKLRRLWGSLVSFAAAGFAEVMKLTTLQTVPVKMLFLDLERVMASYPLLWRIRVALL